MGNRYVFPLQLCGIPDLARNTADISVAMTVGDSLQIDPLYLRL